MEPEPARRRPAGTWCCPPLFSWSTLDVLFSPDCQLLGIGGLSLCMVCKSWAQSVFLKSFLLESPALCGLSRPSARSAGRLQCAPPQAVSLEQACHVRGFRSLIYKMGMISVCLSPGVKVKAKWVCPGTSGAFSVRVVAARKQSWVSLDGGVPLLSVSHVSELRVR